MLAELLIMMGLQGIGYGTNALSEDIETNRWGVYRDKNGNERIRPSLKKVYYGYTKDGECAYKYYDGTIAVNIDYELSKERKQEAINNNNKYYLRANGRSTLGNSDIEGARYCKVGEDDVYYVRRMATYQDRINLKTYSGTFYMDMNYKFIEPIEEQYQKDIDIWGEDKSKIHKIIIDSFNSHIGREKVYGKNNIYYCGSINNYKFIRDRIRR